jgi:hypothetical protein
MVGSSSLQPSRKRDAVQALQAPQGAKVNFGFTAVVSRCFRQ